MRKKALSLALALVMCLGLLPATALAAKVDVSNMPKHEVLSRLPETLPRPARPTTLEQAYVHVDNVKLGTKWSDESTLREITDLVDSLTAGKRTDTQKMKAIFDWVVQNIEYDYVALSYSGILPWERTEEESERAGQAYNVFSAYTNRKAVCDGYSDLCWLMGAIAGIPVAYIDGGAARAAGHHAWNAALVDGKWVFFDATWGEWDMGPDYHNSTSFFVYYDGLYQITVGMDNINLRLRQGFQDQCPASVTIPSFVTIVDGHAFEGCTNLERVTIPDSVTTIWSGAFRGCTSLKSITIPDSVTEIEGYLFADCTSLESVTIPEGVTRIRSYAFAGCTSLKSITIPDSVTNIGQAAFYNCTGLESVTVGAGLTKEDMDNVMAFEGCISLKNMTFANGGSVGADGFFTIENGVLTKYNGYGGAVTIPEGVTEIRPGVFVFCENLTGVTFPRSLKKIGGSAFASCTGLTSLTIPDNVTVEGGAFSGCSGLKSVTIPATVTQSGGFGGMFDGCTGLERVTISDGVTELKSTFGSCTSLTSVTIPGSVKTVNGAFYNCTGLKSVTIQEGVTELDGAFDGCTSLTSVILPQGVTLIGNVTFADCTSLKSITIPASVTKINRLAFRGCTSLTDVYYGGTEEQWKAIQISNEENGALTSATIHYNSAMPQQSQQPTQTKTAAPTNDSLTCNGAAQNPTVYKINDSNYFKIRDLAAILNGTEKQFAVGYDGGKQSVTATTGQGYTKLNSDLIGAPEGGNKTAEISNDAIYVNGERVQAEVYKIDGSNYFKLRDLGKAFDFYVGWTAEQGMYIETDRPYSE